MKSSVALVLLLSWLSAEAYKPVILVHGIGGGMASFTVLKSNIEAAHNGTEVIHMNQFYGWLSTKPLWTQVESFKSELQSIMDRNKEGVHLLCFSQGGLICRALLSVMPNHNIHHFIAMASPLAGYYGGNRFFKYLQTHVVCEGSRANKPSFCQYWKDPHHRDMYLENNNFLPLINGEKENKDAQVWKENFLKIKKLVLIGGPDDGLISPWQSSFFGFYDSDENMVEMRDQEFYISDAFGLKTLDLRGDIEICVQPGVRHMGLRGFRARLSVFNNCIEKWLT